MFVGKSPEEAELAGEEMGSLWGSLKKVASFSPTGLAMRFSPGALAARLAFKNRKKFGNLANYSPTGRIVKGGMRLFRK